MRIQPTQQLTFQYSSPLKTLWLKGKLPSVKTGLYGDVLTKKNVSLEHLKPYSLGGKTQLSNLALASKRNNQARGAQDIGRFLTMKSLLKYLSQFRGVKVKDFDGEKYILNIVKTINELMG